MLLFLCASETETNRKEWDKQCHKLIIPIGTLTPSNLAKRGNSL